VLAYPKLDLSRAAIADALANHDRLAQHAEAGIRMRSVRVPACSDIDDQKFLDLAYSSGAQVLITKDRALLKLARRASGTLRIVTPDVAATLIAATHEVLPRPC
jgi:predicted nucleic acid-binding protein